MISKVYSPGVLGSKMISKVMLFSFCLVFASFSWLSSSALESYVEPNFINIQTQKWWNNASISDTIVYKDGSLARLILKTEGNDSRKLPPFGCGFIRAANSSLYFLAVLLLGGQNTSVADQQVWVANRGRPIGENGTLQFTYDRGLALFDSDNRRVWYSEVVSPAELKGIELVENGKLQLYKGDQSYWQSFDHPTDTFLPGQKLYKDDMLTASASAENWSSDGRYCVQMTSDHFIGFVQVEKQEIYFQLGQRPNRRRDAEALSKDGTVGYKALIKSKTIGLPYTRGGNVYRRGCDCRQEPRPQQSTYAALDGDNLVLAMSGTNYSLTVSPNNAAGAYLFLRLGFDGHLRTYQWQKDNAPKQVYDLVAQELDDCQHPHECGDYGVCLKGVKNCSCPRAVNGSVYFKQKDVGATDSGCYEITPFSCNTSSDMVYFGNLSHFSFIDSQAAEHDLKDRERCKKRCQGSCNCRAAFFKFGNNTSDGECYLVSEMLSIRSDPVPDIGPYNSSAFIKVQLRDSPPPLPDGNQLPSLAPSWSSSQDTSRRKTNLVAILTGSSAAVLALLLSALCIVISRKKRTRKKKEERETDGEDNFHPKLRMPRRFSSGELRAATEDFKDRLGGGGFGTVFRGNLEDGTRIAVKRLDNRGQGMREFLAEVETIGNIHHVNLVRLIGFCADRSSKLLVYEYMSNGSLDAWIFNNQRNGDIDWQARKKIILGIAKGLCYLHDECFQRIVHLDIKPQNILLDDDFNAKISDFGLSKLMERDQSQVQSNIRGTPGYLAPEWKQLRITLKVDIYSFGIVVLEIICGRKNLDNSRSESSKHLLRLLQEKAEVGRVLDIVEGTSIDMRVHGDEVLKMIKLASWCLQDDHGRRPQMSVVVKVLEGAMEVDPDISFRFSNAMVPIPVPVPVPVVSSRSDPPPPSVLSAPR